MHDLMPAMTALVQIRKSRLSVGAYLGSYLSGRAQKPGKYLPERQAKIEVRDS
jgi:hypothetical protein